MFASIAFLALAAQQITIPIGPKPRQIERPKAPIEQSGPQWAAACKDWDEWDKPAPPVRIHGNTYLVGTCGISAILIAGEDGGSGNTLGNLVLRPVGTFTGGATPDCSGFAADEDLPGLVLMADIGPLRVFDEHFDLVGRRIRNFAGMLSSVGIELVDKNDGSSIIAILRVPTGLLEPLTVIDRSLPGSTFELLTRQDSGPIQSFDFPSTPGVPEILSTLPDVNVTVRAVVVDGEAPDFIDDVDGDNKLTARDLRLAGYTLLSNEATMNIHAVQNDAFAEWVNFVKCPTAILAGDLDGDGSSGYSCNTGNARSIRRPPQ